MSGLLQTFQARDRADLERELVGFPAGTVDALLHFQASPGTESLRGILPGFIDHHLPAGTPRCPQAPGDGLQLIQDLGLDSLALSEMAFKMEDVFGFTIETRQMAGIATVGELLAFLQAKLEIP